MKTLTVAVIKSGILEPETVAEINRWGLPVEFVAEEKLLTTKEEVIAHIQEALESEDIVQSRNTDLDILNEYLQNQQQGRLYIHDTDTGHKTSFTVSFCRTKMGDYVIPWRAEALSDLLINASSHLKVTGTKKKIYFLDVNELFFGEHKAFIVCTPSVSEDDDE